MSICHLYQPRPRDPHWLYYGPVQRCCGSCRNWNEVRCYKEKEWTASDRSQGNASRMA